MHENLTFSPMSPNVSSVPLVVPSTSRAPVQGSFFEDGAQTPSTVRSGVKPALTAIVPPVESEKTLESLFEAFHALWNSSDTQEDLERETESNNARVTPEGFRRAYVKSFLFQNRIKGNVHAQMAEIQFLTQYELWAVRKTTESISTKVGNLVAPQTVLPIVATETLDMADPHEVAVREAIGITYQANEIDHQAFEIQALIEELTSLHAEIMEEVESTWIVLTKASGEYYKMDDARATYKLAEFVYYHLRANLPNNGHSGLPESEDPLIQLGKLL